jgi:predicted nucleotidyltransferase
LSTFINPEISEIPNLGDSGAHEWSILMVYRGSISHGMYVPNTDPNSIDDKDLMGVCVPPEQYYLGLKEYGSRGTKEIKEDEWDVVIYEARKFIHLLQMGNPNVLSILWLDKSMFLKITYAGRLLLDARSIFVGKHVFKSFAGYANGQLHRMEHGACMGYMGEKRKKLIGKFGYDTKNGAHLIRLLRMCVEFLNTGEMTVVRPDAKELLEIKRGEWTLAEVKQESDRLFVAAKEAQDKSTLPEFPDTDRIAELAVTVVKTQLGL